MLIHMISYCQRIRLFPIDINIFRPGRLPRGATSLATIPFPFMTAAIAQQARAALPFVDTEETSKSHGRSLLPNRLTDSYITQL